MDTQTINDLLDASTHGDSREAHLENLLRRIRDAFFGKTDNPPAIWIAKSDLSEERVLVTLIDDKVTFSIDDDDKPQPVDLPDASDAYKVELTPSQRSIGLYLAFSTRPTVSVDLLQVAQKLIGNTLVALVQERRETIIYGLLNSFREDIFRPAQPIGKKDMLMVAKGVADAFCSSHVWAVLYDFRSWRNPRTQPLIVSHGDDLPGISSSYFNERIKLEIRNLLQGTDSSNGRTVIIPPQSDTIDEVRTFIACAGLAPSRQQDPVAGRPYVAIVVKEDDENRLDVEERRLIERFVLELQRVLRLRESLTHMQGLGQLLEKFLSLSTPAEIANSAINFLADTFSPSEIAVLERRGMFLSIIGQKNVPLKIMPPLHIPTTPARATLAARTGKDLYDKNVRHEKDAYLEVVEATRSQFTVPLIWRGETVGVLLLGLSVVDGLEPRDRNFIQALAGYCGAAIAGSQRTSDERAVTHMLREVLTGAALNLRHVIESEEIQPANKAELQGTYDLLDHCQTFIERFRQAQAAGYQQGRIDLRDAVLKYREEPLVQAILKNHPGCSLEIDAGTESLIANAHYEGIQLALTNLVVNALEAMENCPGRVIVSVKKELVQYQARRRAAYGVINVVDEGKGISRQEQSKIFDLFYSTKPKHLGTGLRIAQNIIEKFGGRIEVQSPPNPDCEKGTAFSLWIPIGPKGVSDGQATS